MTKADQHEVDLIQHAVNFRQRADAVTATVYHSALQAVIHEQFALSSSDVVVLYETVLRQPRIQWEFCDNTLDTAMPDTTLHYVFLVPENTERDSRSLLAVNARKALSYPSDWSEEQGSIDLGSRLESPMREAGSSHQHIVRLICRRKGDPTLSGLKESLQGLGGFPKRYVLPIWGSATDINLWAECLRDWTEGWQDSIQTPPASVLVRYRDIEEERARANQLEQALLRLGVPCCSAEEVTRGGGVTYIEYLNNSCAKAGTGQSSFPVEALDRWCRSGVMMSADRWKLLERHVIS